MPPIKPLPAYLRDIQEEVEGYATNFGLNFFPILYEVLDYKTMNEVAAYGGFPTRYPHWRFGMDYEQLAKSYEWGLSKIYEMVINTNPAYAYLLEGNSTTDQKIVMAHVCAHVDFFKNNYYFSKTNRKMIDGMANHASRVRPCRCEGPKLLLSARALLAKFSPRIAAIAQESVCFESIACIPPKTLAAVAAHERAECLTEPKSLYFNK